MRLIAGVILEDDFGRILLQLRDDKPTIASPNMWGHFGGAVEQDETPFEGALREIDEELCIQLSPDRLRPFTIYKELPQKWVHIFHYSIDASEIACVKLMEGQRFGLFTQAQIEVGVIERHEIAPHARAIFVEFYAN